MAERIPKNFPELWQPIATAPRDGTFVLTRSGYWAPCITHFATYDGKTRWGPSPESFMEEDHFLQHWHEVSYDPTHWMPLPDTEVTDVIEAAYRNGFEDGEKHAADCHAALQSQEATYRYIIDELMQKKITVAAIDVIKERRRQVEAEDFSASHDDMATKGQLATAAACYAFQAGARGRNFPGDPEPIGIWPWDREWWKPADARRNLIKAGALVLAEIERLDRAAANNAKGCVE